jgi:putative two-component system response regulator
MNALNEQYAAARIVVVDDQASNLKLVDRMLQRAGYEHVRCLQTGTDVEDIVTRDDIDLILLDLNMPVLDGYAVMRRLAQLDLDVPPAVLVLTAQNGREHRHRALLSGANDYISKPFDEIELLARMKNLLDSRIARKALYEQNLELDARVRARTDELYQTRLEIVRRLGRAAEYRDNETGMHILRMSRMSVVLAEQIGLSTQECELLLNAAPMHDIGKIGIPDHILLKPGKLDADEWEVMKTHTTIGAQILSGSDSDLMCMAREIALTHHEKWDGSGYPYGLSGESIPLVGRIVAVADVFDALTSERPYKKPWSLDEAVDFLRRNAGGHFDPELVATFERRLDDFAAIKQTYPDESVVLASEDGTSPRKNYA